MNKNTFHRLAVPEGIPHLDVAVDDTADHAAAAEAAEARQNQKQHGLQRVSR